MNNNICEKCREKNDCIKVRDLKSYADAFGIRKCKIIVIKCKVYDKLKEADDD